MIGYLLFKKTDMDHKYCINDFDVNINLNDLYFFSFNSEFLSKSFDISEVLLTLIKYPDAEIHKITMSDNERYVKIDENPIAFNDFLEKNKTECISLLKSIYNKYNYKYIYVYSDIYSHLKSFYNILNRDIQEEIDKHLNKYSILNVSEDVNINLFFQYICQTFQVDEFFINLLPPYFLYKLIKNYYYFTPEQVASIWKRICSLSQDTSLDIVDHGELDGLSLSDINVEFSNLPNGALDNVEDLLISLHSYESVAEKVKVPEIALKIELFKRIDVYKDNLSGISKRDLIGFNIYNPNADTEITLKTFQSKKRYDQQEGYVIDEILENISYKKSINLNKIWNFLKRYKHPLSSIYKSRFISRISNNNYLQNLIFPKRITQKEFSQMLSFIAYNYSLLKSYIQNYNGQADIKSDKYINLYSKIYTGKNEIDLQKNILNNIVQDIGYPFMFNFIILYWNEQIKHIIDKSEGSIKIKKQINDNILEFCSEIEQKL